MNFSAKIQPPDIFERKSGLQWRVIEEKVVLVDAPEAELVQFNQTGTFIWLNLNGKNSIDEIILKLSAETDAPLKTIERDAKKFISRLSEMELVRRKCAHD